MLNLFERGRHSTKTLVLFILLVAAVSTIAFVTYADDLNCFVACQNDSGCDDGNPLTIDVCNNDASCEASCSNIETGPACKIACHNDSGCDDGNPNTIDICNNDGECNSSCANIPISSNECEIACSRDFDCMDNNSFTLDICSNDGTCEAECIHLPREEEDAVIIENVQPSEPEEDFFIIESVQESPESLDSCNCPISGTWTIKNGDNCTLSSTCNLSGDLHIVNGSLNISSTGTLVIPSQAKTIIESSNAKLIVEDGGRLVMHQ